MQKLHKSKTPKVYKNKKLNNANFGTYNLNDYQVFLQLVSKLGKVDVNGTYQQPQDLEREHTLTAKEFSQAFGVDLNTSYGVLKRASNKLARTAITLEKPELFEIWDIPVCEISKYNTKFRKYNDLKNRTFAHAVDEINSQYPTMKLRFEEVKEGRKVVSIRFEFTPSHKEQGYNPATKQLVNVTVKPKQAQPKPSKKDDDNTPPPVHPKQQELPNISKKPAIAEKAVTAIAKTMKSLGAEQEPEIKQALENNTSVIDASLEVIKRRTIYITEQAKIIAESLGISKAEAYAIAKKDFEEEESKLSH